MTPHNYGDGTIYQRRVDGRWYGAIDVGRVTGRRQRVTVSSRSRPAVEVRLGRLRGRVTAADPELTVGDWLTGWLGDLLPGTVAAPNTLANYRWAVERHLLPGLGQLVLVDLSPVDVARFLAAKLEAGLAVRTVARLRTVLTSALAQAVLHGHLQRNVGLLVRSPRGPIRPGRSLSLEQARSLLAAAQGERFGVAFVLMLLLGLRPGETLGLRWADVDLDAGLLSVTHSLKRESSGLRLGPTKTAQSRRCLALPKPVLAALVTHRDHQADQRRAAGERWDDHNLVVATRHGRPVDHTILRSDLSSLTTRCGLGHWHPHELRHSAVSLLSAAGVRLEDVADIVGHRSTRTTFTDQAQSIEATPAGCRERRCSSSASAGVFHPRIFRGRALSALATASMSSALQRERSVPFGKYWRSRPFVFSFVPRCQGLRGSAKNTGIPVSILNTACADNSLPRSHVKDRRSCAGNVLIVDASAFFIVTAP